MLPQPLQDYLLDGLIDTRDQISYDGREWTRIDEIDHIEALKELGQPEAGLLVAAFVARATNGVEKAEAEVLKAIAKAAGLSADKVKTIVKRATGIE